MAQDCNQASDSKFYKSQFQVELRYILLTYFINYSSASEVLVR
jgi:hypothetical protein